MAAGCSPQIILGLHSNDVGRMRRTLCRVKEKSPPEPKPEHKACAVPFGECRAGVPCTGIGSHVAIATNVLTRSESLASPSIPMNFFRYMIDGHEAQRRHRVLSCP